jgi:hypothetical protein
MSFGIKEDRYTEEGAQACAHRVIATTCSN